MDSKVGKTFKLTKKLGSGAFGEIFHGINVYHLVNDQLKNNAEVAIKLEPISAKHPQLFFEAKLYSHLLENENSNDRGNHYFKF
jgi:casein kinase 1/casein kinase 1 epsilon